MKMRTSAWEAQAHPFLKDTVLANEHLIDLYKNRKLSKEDVALILGTSADYTRWLISKWETRRNFSSEPSSGEIVS
jgi:hypothetical protein